MKRGVINSIMCKCADVRMKDQFAHSRILVFAHLMTTLSLFFLVTSLSSCKTKEKAVTSPTAQNTSSSRPTWVLQRPTSSAYYVGIGVSSKRGNGPEFAQIAKRNALSDLAAEIKVSVSSNSVYSQYESDTRFKEDFNDVIRLNAKEEIEDFEVVDAWENKDEFWIYYRLSKARYREQKQAKITKAVESAKTYLAKAKLAESEVRIADALQNNYLAFYEIEALLDEDLQTDWNGEQIYLGKFLVKEIRRLLQSVQVMPVAEVQTTILWGSVVDENNPAFVLSLGGKSVASMKVKYSVKGVQLESYEGQSDENGQVRAAFKNVPTNKSQFELTASLQTPNSESRVLNDILKQAGNSKSTLRYSIRKPTIYVYSEEKNLNVVMTENILANNMKALLSEEGFKVTTQSSEADYRMSISSNTSKGGNANGFFTCYLNGRVVMERRDGTEQFSYALTQIKGLKLDYPAASLQSYKEAAEHLEKQTIPALLRSF